MNAKTAQTKKKLTEALLMLTQGRSVHEISVSDLCRTAGVNRTTFYKYYSTPEDVGEEYLRESVFSYADSIHEASFDLHTMMLETCEFFSKGLTSPENLKYLIGDTHFLDRTIREFLLYLRHDLSLLSSGNIYFIAGGIASVISHWRRHEPELPAEEVAQMLTEYVITMEK